MVRYPVRFTGYPANYVLVNDTPFFVNALIKGRGYDLLWPRYGIKAPLSVDLQGTKISADGSNRYKFTTSSLKRLIQASAGTSVQVTAILPDALYISVSPVHMKKVPVKPVVRLTFAKQYMLCQPYSCIPDSITVTGALSVIDTLQFIPTKTLIISDLKKSCSETVPLAGNNSLHCQPDKVQITMEVDKFTETSLRIPVQVINLPAGLRMKTFPAEVTISFRICVNHYKEIIPESFIVSVNYRDLKPDTTATLPVYMLQKPDFADNILIAPSEVEFILE